MTTRKVPGSRKRADVDLSILNSRGIPTESLRALWAVLNEGDLREFPQRTISKARKLGAIVSDVTLLMWERDECLCTEVVHVGMFDCRDKNQYVPYMWDWTSDWLTACAYPYPIKLDETLAPFLTDFCECRVSQLGRLITNHCPALLPREVVAAVLDRVVGSDEWGNLDAESCDDFMSKHYEER